MKSFRKGLKRRAAINMLVQPFKAMPLVNTAGQDAERINAHDLFSFYTANIIKEDIIFSR